MSGRFFFTMIHDIYVTWDSLVFKLVWMLTGKFIDAYLSWLLIPVSSHHRTSCALSKSS